MLNYNKLKQKYATLIKETLEKNKKILIDSFVQYYGEKYRSLIEKRYNEITFVYYIDWTLIDVTIKEFLPQVDNPKKYEDFINFSNSRKTKSSFIDPFKRKKRLPDNLIGSTNKEILKDGYINQRLFKTLCRRFPSSWNYGSAKTMDRVITFPILALDEAVIIHEINHAITRDNIMCLLSDNYEVEGVVEKVGLNLSTSDERNIEELLNEKSSMDITSIFKSKGGDLSSFCLNIPLVYTYRYNFYLVDEFYDSFKPYIKIARISENKNELVARVGKELYEKLAEIVDEYYSADLSVIAERKKVAQPLVHLIIDEMKKSIDESELTNEDLQKYYKELENSGHKVRVLNEPDERETEPKKR